MKRFCDLRCKEQNETKIFVHQLLLDKKGYKKIRRALREKNIAISLGTLSYWRNKDPRRLLKNGFEAKPSPELSYFIGVMFGDGCACVDKKNHDYCLQLGATDKEFVEKFAQCVSKLLGKISTYPVHKGRPNMFFANIRSKELYEFVKEIKFDFEKAKPFIEAFPAEFLQGLADSEGNPSISAAKKFSFKVAIANSANLELIQYAQDLLIRFFNIKSISRLTKKAGMQDSVIEGRLITRTKNVYLIETIDFFGTCAYFSKIGFSIIRKQQKLQDALWIKSNFKTSSQINEWKKVYHKVGRQWKHIQLICPT